MRSVRWATASDDAAFEVNVNRRPIMRVVNSVLNWDEREMPYDVELEEWRQIQAIVGRHEDHAFKVRGVMYTLLTALTLPLFAEKRVITGQTFLTLSAIVVVLLLIVELVHRAFVRLAIERGARIEQILRDKEQYDGPKIAVSLGQSRIIEMMIQEVFLPSIAVHYVALLISLVVISCVMW